MHALVTGAAGFVGSHLVERLCADGHETLALDRLPAHGDETRKRERLRSLEETWPTCRAVVADLRTCDLAELLDGVDVVFHQAGRSGGPRSRVARPGTPVEHDVVVTERLLDAAAGSGIRRFVHASCSSVYGEASTFPTEEDEPPDPVSPRGVMNLAAEHLCRAYARVRGVPTVSLRYFTVYGPRQRPDMAIHGLIEAALSGDPFTLFGDGRQIRDFTYVDDVIEANLAATLADVPPGTVVNIAGGASASLLEVIAMLGRLTGRPIRVAHRPAEVGDVTRTEGSIERARRLMGWRPRVPLAHGLAAQVTWQALRRVSERSA
jgi:nucleoside-diphosphate-sugar epimerase